uniref:Uncharacterized protein n=1 Tax=Panagrolaimus davidi TaxID=227884 RepID=A0A914R0I8_9BILA
MLTFDFVNTECLKLFSFFPLFFHLIFISATFIACCDKKSGRSTRQYYQPQAQPQQQQSATPSPVPAQAPQAYVQPAPQPPQASAPPPSSPPPTPSAPPLTSQSRKSFDF